jgi:hypothetical protein
MFDTNDNDMYWELEISLLFNRSNFNDDQIIPLDLVWLMKVNRLSK